MLARLAICALLAVSAPGAGAEPAPSLPKNALPLPLIRQATEYSCGVASLLSILYYWKAYDGGESSLYERLGTTPKDGTEPDKIAEVARSFGLSARLQEGASVDDLRRALRAGETVVLDLQAWRGEAAKKKAWKELWDEGHYVVLAGMDATFLYAMDPSAAAGYAYLPISEFAERWHDYSDRGGKRRDFHNAAIFIKGKVPLAGVPGPLVRME
jgi:predicted double-glycine peptidase